MSNASLACARFGNLLGFDSAMMNGLQALPQWKSHFTSHPPALLCVINSIYPIGKLVGLYPATWLSDRYGRRADIGLTRPVGIVDHCQG
ncbi:uncharacterized protein RSE6_10574 [Rhynchosporium secalis]|uniref:Major facilitator superfamily (MFS) profile domain-containing protein n=1 Tax=Rhynchosporium secalis TaxID=38038 RepID=A0A1E1MKS2_RHYSE|nr:uncharacterized protein RSE6_10574 [Rhynchosporium secalis]